MASSPDASRAWVTLPLARVVAGARSCERYVPSSRHPRLGTGGIAIPTIAIRWSRRSVRDSARVRCRRSRATQRSPLSRPAILQSALCIAMFHGAGGQDTQPGPSRKCMRQLRCDLAGNEPNLRAGIGRHERQDRHDSTFRELRRPGSCAGTFIAGIKR